MRPARSTEREGRYIVCDAVYSGGWIEVKVKVKFTLEQATKAQRDSRSIALLFL